MYWVRDIIYVAMANCSTGSLNRKLSPMVGVLRLAIRSLEIGTSEPETSDGTRYYAEIDRLGLPDQILFGDKMP